MRRRKGIDGVEGLLLLLCFILLLPLVKKALSPSGGFEGPFDGKGTYIEIKGDVRSPGVYGFSGRPGPEELLFRAGGDPAPIGGGVTLHSGASVEAKKENGGIRLFMGEMSAFRKTTLGIPLSINRESAAELTAVPGVGLKTAHAIVRERERRGGFKKLDEILELDGIGPLLYQKIRPLLTL